VKPALTLLTALLLALFGQAAEIQPLQDKTLVVWAAPANLTQRGGSVLTINDGRGHFDGIVFGERAPAKWMAGSERFTRTGKPQSDSPQETAGPDTAVQIAIVYRGDEVTAYRNGREYSRHTIAKPHPFDLNSVIVIGPRHLGNSDFFAGAVEDARIYDRALTAAEIAALQPNVEGAIKPWAWWTFDDANAKDRTGRFAQTRLTAGAKVENSRLILDGLGGSFFAASQAELLPVVAESPKASVPATVPEDMVLNYHLMHPGGPSAPADPNAAFYLDGVYHLHYILAHPWREKKSYSFVHVTSPDMLHWTWQPTKLQPSFTGHGMFSGTGFITKEGKPAIIYHGEKSGRNWIALAKDNQLSAWEKPYPVEPKMEDGSEPQMRQWDPDCFRIGDTYYAISGGQNPPLIKSKDLKNWSHIGDFLRHDLPNVALGEDISCGNFFPLGDPSAKLGTGKWMLLCISHPFGLRYYIGDWDAKAEQFVPETAGRMTWQPADKSIRRPCRAEVFAPESVLTSDGRRVMWAWCAQLVDGRSVQSLPRELSLPADGILRIKPLREIETLRYDPVVLHKLQFNEDYKSFAGRFADHHITELPGDSVELRITVDRAQADRRCFGFTLFSDGKGGGLPILIRPDTRTLRVGEIEAPFAVSDLPPGEDLELRIFIDKYLVEVFVNDRQAVAVTCLDYQKSPNLDAFTFGPPPVIRTLEMWKLKPTNQGFREAQKNRLWEPDTK
jgi:beta-fructofuranosidase